MENKSKLIKINGDYHTHTIYSHGKGTVAQSVASASELGLKTIAIAEHGPGHLTYGVKKQALMALKAEIEALKPLYPHMHIKFGLEANIMNVEGQIDVDDELLAELDFVMAGYHFGSAPTRLFRDLGWHVSNLLVGFVPFLKAFCIKRNTKAYINAMRRYRLFAITHPGAKGPLDVAAVAKVAFETGTLLEINAHHGHLTVEAIKIAKKHNARFIINSDAHAPEHVGLTAKGIERALEAGLTSQDIFNVDLD